MSQYPNSPWGLGCWLDFFILLFLVFGALFLITGC
jgi:hypothetical protein